MTKLTVSLIRFFGKARTMIFFLALLALPSFAQGSKFGVGMVPHEVPEH